MTAPVNAAPVSASSGLARDGLRFTLAGLVNTGLTVLLYQALLGLAGPTLSYAIAWIAGLSFVFLVYPSKVFPDGRRDAAARGLIALVYAASFCLGLVVVEAVSRVLGAERLAILASLVVTTGFNFAAMRWVLRSQPVSGAGLRHPPHDASVPLDERPSDAGRHGRAWPGGLLAAIFFLSVVLWSLLIPFNEAPDETTHFFLVEYIYAFKSLPQPWVDPREPLIGPLTGTTYTNRQFWYQGLPFLHVLGAVSSASLFAKLLPASLAYLAARAFNWLLALPFALAMFSVARSGQAGEGGRHAALPIAFVVIFIPQVVFVFSYFNSDAFGLTATALSLAAFLSAAREPGTLRGFLFGCACGLVLLSKVYFFPSLVFYGCALIALRLLRREFPLVRLVAAAAGGALLVAAPMLIVTYAHFGEVTGLSGQRQFAILHQGNPNAGFGTCFLLCPNGLIDIDRVAAWGQLTFRSFFGVFGWMSVYLDVAVYDYFFAPLLGGFLAWSLWVLGRSARAALKGDPSAVWIAVVCILFWGMFGGTTLMSLISSQLTLPQPQGRYLFVVVPFAAYVLALLGGDGGIPGRERRAASLRPSPDAQT